MKRILGSITCLLLMIFTTGCSHSSPPVAPVLRETAEPSVTTAESPHNILGLYTFVCDPDSGNVDVIPIRDAEFHLNALKFLEPPPYLHLTLESPPKFNGNVLDVDIGLRHPFLGQDVYTGFDVCGIVFTHGSVTGFNDLDIVVAGEGDTRLLNADGYTRWWNPKEFPHGDTIYNYKDGLLGNPADTVDFNCTINGYKYFADGLGKDGQLPPDLRGMFSPGTKNIRHYKIDLSGGLVFNYAVDACWKLPQGSPPYTVPDDFPPDANRPEAYGIFYIDMLKKNTLYCDTVSGNAGGELVFVIGAFDWFNADLNKAWGDSPAGLTFGYSKLVDSGEGYGYYEFGCTGEALKYNGDAPFIFAIESEKTGYGGILPGEPECFYFVLTIHIDDEPFGVRVWGGPGQDSANDLVVNNSTGDIYVTGWFESVVDFDPGEGVDEHLSNGGSDIFLSKFDNSGDFQWTRTIGGGFSDHGEAVITDESDSIYIGGNYADELVDFDPGPGVDEHINYGSFDLFISKYDPNGIYKWTITWGGSEKEFFSGMTIDNNGNIYATGYFESTVDFDPGPGVDEHTSQGVRDAFLCKFNADGQFQWARTWGGDMHDMGMKLDTIGNSEIYVLGWFGDNVDFDPGDEDELVTSSGDTDIFLSKFDADGNFCWVRTFGGADRESSDGLLVSNTSEIYITGYYSSTADFDPGPGVEEYTSKGSRDVFFCKYNTNGDYKWTRVWGGTGQDSGQEFGLDSYGNIIVTGEFMETVDFDPGPELAEMTSNGSRDVFISKFDPDGNFIWVKTFGGMGYDECEGTSTYHLGNIFLAGSFRHTVDFDPGPGVYNAVSKGTYDVFLCKLDPDGEW